MPTPPLAKDVRFTSAEQIIAAIDKANKRSEELKRAAYNLDQRADKLLKKLDGVTPPESQGNEAAEVRNKIQSCRDRANRKRNKSVKIQQIYISRLKGKLACIQTMILPGVDIPTDIPQ